VAAEKKLRGFQHIIQELSAENAELKERSDHLAEETTLLKEVSPSSRPALKAVSDDMQEIKLMEEAGEGGSADLKELREARATVEANEQTIREVNHRPCLT